MLPSNDHEMEEYDENVAALKLLKTKSSAVQTIQDLLKATRDLRLKWLSSSPISIHDIVEKYPVLAKPKWVSTRCICTSSTSLKCLYRRLGNFLLLNDFHC